MWTKQSLAVWILLATAAHSAAPAPEPPAKNTPYSTAQGLFNSAIGSLLASGGSPAAPAPKQPAKNKPLPTAQGLFNSAIGSIQNAFIPSSERTDATVVKGFYTKALNGLKAMQWNPCVLPICGGREMKMWDMRVDLTQENITMEVNDKEIRPAEPGYVIAPVKFTFPENMILKCKFQFEGNIMMMSYTRQGDAKFKIGPIIVTTEVKLPMTKTAIQKVPDKMKCQYRMPPQGVNSKGGTFDVMEVNYSSVTRTDYSKPRMIELFNQMKRDIIKALSHNLASHVVMVVEKVVFSCLDDKAKQTWTPPTPSGDCEKCQ